MDTKGYYDVAFKVGDVLLLNDTGTGDALAWEMEERCLNIIDHYCKEWSLEIPWLNDYPDNDHGRYDSVEVRDWYIGQLCPLFWSGSSLLH